MLLYWGLLRWCGRSSELNAARCTPYAARSRVTEDNESLAASNVQLVACSVKRKSFGLSLLHYKHRRHRSLPFFITWLDGLLSIDEQTTAAAAIEIQCFCAADVF